MTIGVGDGEVDYGDLNVTNDCYLDDYITDEAFADLMDTLLR